MRYLGARISDLPTPCLLVDQSAMRRNLACMQSLVQGKGKSLRAHAKTHKSSCLATLQRESGAIGICAAKLSEAEVLIANKVGGILITGPVVTDEAHGRLIACLEASPDLIITLDDLDNARRLSKKLEKQGRDLSCLIDLDPGFHRTGVPLEYAGEFASALQTLPRIKIRGVQAYAGDLQHIQSFKERSELSSQALGKAAGIVDQLRLRGLEIDIFSVGGTGTAQIDANFPFVTEIQAGSYLLMDEEYSAIDWAETAPPFESSLSLLTTVVSANHRKFATIDAGLKAMYRDGGIPRIVDPPNAGTFEWFGDEYGKITPASPDETFSVGQKIRLSISHSDPTVNLFDVFFATNGDAVVDVYPIDMRGRSQ